ncbi:bifunctional metallophosphatase/5'-nucleotidase [Bacillus sp. 1P06AnD]|uniref:bifunctional metallophosphatase/5'-nucleotidase n=1 Tax=Bacillus sp. 1P06AnD TaxID=3132208 RepID=UPI0039A11E05
MTVMHTNDTHANLDNVARTITAIKQVRAERPYNVLLSAGDVFSGTLYFNKYKGQADLEFMNLAGYDAMTFGNHEFDLGSEPLAPFVKNAKFPFVSANVDFSQDLLMKELQRKEYSDNPENGKIFNGIVKTINGQKVGIFGLTTEETPSISSPGSIAFKNYVDSAKEAVNEFEKQGINKIIAVTHIGYTDGGGDNDLLLAKYVEGIDVIVGGHDHYQIDKPVKVTNFGEPTIIVQAKEYNKYLGTLNVGFDENGKVVSHHGGLIDLNAKAADGSYKIPEDAEAKEILETKYKPAVDEMKQEVVGKTTVELAGGNPAARTAETNLGNFIADGMLAKAKKINPETTIALQNGGGVRTTIKAGDITTSDILTVLPFGNALGIMELTGAEIQEALEHSVKEAPKPSGAFLQIAGLKYTYDSTKPEGSRVLSVEAADKDGHYAPLNLTQTYTIATNIFTAKGGDGYEMFAKAYAEGRVSEPGFVDWEVFKEYLEVQPEKTISPAVEGRIIDAAAKKD